ncbi:MAG: hypothetical protein J6386_21360 [Candidatus Synoicihabitans palmerolidicus]|nr:hypothetical protein [Candidatus Synoicihabitans palmerolidicus]
MNVLPIIRTVGLIAANTWQELWRQRSMVLLVALAVVATGGGWVWRDFNLGRSQAEVLMNFGSGMQGLLATLMAVVGSAQVFTREFEDGSAAVILSGPTRKSTWVLGKSLGVWATVEALWSAVYGRHSGRVADISGERVDGRELVTLLVILSAKQFVVVAGTTWLACLGRSLFFVVMAALLCGAAPVSCAFSRSRRMRCYR